MLLCTAEMCYNSIDEHTIIYMYFIRMEAVMEKNEKNRKTLKFGLTVIIVPLVVTLLVTLTCVAAVQLYLKMNRMYSDMILREAGMYTNQMDGWINNIRGKVQQLGKGMEQLEFESDEDKLRYMKTSLEIDESMPYGVYSGNKEGGYWDAGDWVPDEGYVPSERQWYIDGADQKDLVMGEPYVDQQTGEIIVSASMQISGTEVMAADVYLNKLGDMTDTFSILGEGTSFIIEERTGILLAYPDKALIGTNAYQSDDGLVQAAVEALKRSDLSNTNINDPDRIVIARDGSKRHMFICNYIEDTDWVFISQAPVSVILKQVLSAILVDVLVGSIMLCLFVALIVFVLDRKTKPITAMSKVIHLISQGDFTVNVTKSGNNEITTLSENLDGYVVNMRDTLNQMTKVAKGLNKHAFESKQTADILLESSTIQVDSTSRMNDTMENILSATQSIAENATNLAGTVGNLNENGEIVQAKMNETVQETNRGKLEIEEIDSRIGGLNDTMKNLEGSILKVEKATSEIFSITETISDIASQTNLLALNASIEAARAGEAGKGFSVVATEISKLASESEESVKNISRIIDNIHGLVNDTVKKTRDSLSDMEYSVESVRRTKDTFEHIHMTIANSSDILDRVVDQITDINDVVANLAAATQQQSASMHIVQGTMSEIVDAANNIKTASTSSEEIAVLLKEAADDMSDRLQAYKTVE